MHQTAHRHGFTPNLGASDRELSHQQRGGAGIHQNIGTTSQWRRTICNNAIWNMRRGVGITALDNVLVLQQPGVEQSQCVLSAFLDPKGTKVFNNTIYDHAKGSGIKVEGPLWGNNSAADTQVFNNISYKNVVATQDEGSNTTEGNNLFTDP
ncbi:MAG: hypothetical protein R3C68_12650 [Myxococcota bacterium]